MAGYIVDEVGVRSCVTSRHYIRDVRAKVTKRVETEVEKARRALERAEAAELKKENARIAAHKKLWKQLHKELKAYLKARRALANLLK